MPDISSYVVNNVEYGYADTKARATINNAQKSIINSYIEQAMGSEYGWTKQRIDVATGSAATSTTRWRTDFFTIDKIAGFYIANNYKYAIYVYDSEKVYQGIYTNGNFIKSMNWLTENILLSEIPSGYFIRILLARSDDTTVNDEDINAIRVYTYTDETLSKSGKAADAEIVKNITGFLQFPRFRSGLRQTSGSVYTNTDKTITFSSYMYVGAGSQISIILRRNFKYTLLSSDTDGGSLTTIVSGSQKAEFIAPYDYICMNISEYDENDNAIVISAAEVNAAKVVILTKGNYAKSSGDTSTVNAITGFLQFPQFRKGVRQTNGKLYTNTDKTITFSNYLYVGAGSRISVILRRNFKYTLLSGETDGGSLVTVGKGMQVSDFIAPYDYICMNVSEYDENDNAIVISAANVNSAQDVILIKGNYAMAESELQPDVPENLGVINTLLNAKQLTNISYTPTATLPVMGGDFEPDVEVKGITYSSTRKEELFCANSVSLHTFMTAVLNPNSYLYTRQSYVSNSKTYYGAVCSTFVGYCYGFRDWIPTTYMLDKIDGMERIENQTAYGLKLGDMILEPTVHARIVTGIVRNRKTGYIDSITISEAWPPKCRTQKKTVAQINAWLAGECIAYRYNKIYAVDYIPDPWIQLNNEDEEPIYSEHLSPRRGDKAIWRGDEDIEIDILDSEDYIGYKLYKDDVLLSTEMLDGDLIVITNPGVGAYKVCLTDGINDSEFVFFNIVTSTETYTSLGNGAIKCTFNSANGTPTSVAWNYRAQDHGGKSYVIFQIDVLTPEQINAGEAIISCDTLGSYMLRVTYKNEFGLYYSDVQEVEVL